MPGTLTKDSNDLTMNVHLSAPPATVWKAWTERGQLAKWFSPFPAGDCKVHNLDVKASGQYRVTMRDGQGAEYTIGGSFHTVDAPKALAFTWAWDGDPATTLVKVRLEPMGTGTMLHLQHVGFADKAEVDRTAEGWTGCFTKLRDALA